MYDSRGVLGSEPQECSEKYPREAGERAFLPGRLNPRDVLGKLMSDGFPFPLHQPLCQSGS